MATTLADPATTLDPAKLERVAYMLKSLAHPIRLSILRMLETTPEMAVGELCQALNTEQSLTSHHLAQMKMKGILSCRREGKNVYYTLALPDLLQVIRCVENCACQNGAQA